MHTGVSSNVYLLCAHSSMFRSLYDHNQGGNNGSMWEIFSLLCCVTGQKILALSDLISQSYVYVIVDSLVISLKMVAYRLKHVGVSIKQYCCYFGVSF